MGLSNIVVKFLHKGRFFLLQHFNRNVNVVVDGTPNIHKNADVEVGKYSMLKIGYGFTMRKNSIIAPEPMTQCSPIVTPLRIVTFEPIQVLSFIFTSLNT